MPDSNLLVATVKNDGATILEWVAYHSLIGFDNILIFQNDSNDLTDEILKELDDLGVITYVENLAKPGRWQSKAYRTASGHRLFQNSSWVMALDIDEYLHIKTTNGTVASLTALHSSFDAIVLNWKRFGSAGREAAFDSELLIDKYQKAEKAELISERAVGFKTLFRSTSFSRVGIHRPKQPQKVGIKYVNGSGVEVSSVDLGNWAAQDPLLRKHAQINHYMVQSAADYILKAARGSSSQFSRVVGVRYWDANNLNDEEDAGMARWSELVHAKMRELDSLSSGRLLKLRERSIKIREGQFKEIMKDEAYRRLYAKLTKL